MTEADFARLELKFDAHVAENETQHKAILYELKRHGDEETKMREHLFGNGRIGIDEMVRSQQRFIGTLRKFLWWASLGIAGFFARLIWQVIEHFVKNQ